MAEAPPEPDRYEAIAAEDRVEELYQDTLRRLGERRWPGTVPLVAMVKAAESSALERAAQVVDDEDEGPHGMDYQLGDVSDFRARCVKAIRALKQSHERSNDEVANVELRMSSTAVDAAGVGRDAPVPSQEKAPGHPTSDALKPPAAAPQSGEGR